MKKINRRDFIAIGGCSLLGTYLSAGEQDTTLGTVHTDLCVYGATASGIMAAVAARREGMRVVIIEPSRWLGGMTGGGLMHIDWGRRQAVGGTTRKTLNSKYDDTVYRKIFRKIIEKYAIQVVYEHRLTSLRKTGKKIKSIELEYAPPDQLGCPIPYAIVNHSMRVEADVFIDCSYEGELMARSGVSYTYGREAAEEYDESLGGVPPNMVEYDIDPYVKPGNPSSGLIPLVQDIKMNPIGSADKLTMGYGFRWKFTKEPDQIPIGAPEDYDPRTYEVYRRAYQNKISLLGRRTRKLGVYEKCGGHVHGIGTGNQARSLYTNTVYGSNANYPEGDYAERARIWKFLQNHLMGFTHFLRTDPSVPLDKRENARKVGFMPDYFDDTGGLPHQLYVRECRRMVSDYVVCQKDMEGKTDPSDSVGLASYGVDDWPYAMFPLNGKIVLNGGEFSMLRLDPVYDGIYKIPYRSITPKASECTNLFVPVCCSASHIAMTSLRMEPVWMILGESAGIAAAMAIREDIPVQKVDYTKLRNKLLEKGQILERPQV